MGVIEAFIGLELVYWAFLIFFFSLSKGLNPRKILFSDSV